MERIVCMNDGIALCVVDMIKSGKHSSDEGAGCRLTLDGGRSLTSEK